MKRILAALLALVMVLALCACGSEPAPSAPADPATPADPAAPAAPAEPVVDDTVYTLRFATTESEATVRYKMLEKPLMDLITEKSGGRIQFQFFPSSSLAGSGAIFKGMQDGICDIGMDNINSYPGVYLYSELMATPGIYLGNDFDTKAENMKAFVDAYAFDEYKQNGLYLLGTFPAVETVLMTKFPIETTADFAGKTFCCNANYAKMFEDQNGATTWIVPPEQYEALHLSVIDATVNGAGPLSAFKLFEVLDYAYYVPFATITSTYCISQKTYESLPADLQQVLDEVRDSEEFRAINKAYVEAMMGDVAAACAEGNPEFVFADLPADVAAAMQASCAATVDAKLAELANAGRDADGVKALFDSFAQ